MAKENKPEAPPVEGEVQKKKGLFSPKILIITGSVLVMLVGSYFLQKTLLFGSTSTTVTEAKHGEEKKSEEGEEKGEGKEGENSTKVVLLDEIIINPADTGGRRYLALTAGLQTSVPEAEKKVEEQRALVRDAIISLLSTKHLEELADIKYRDSLKIQIKDAVNAKAKGLKIESVLFSGYVLQ